MLKASRSCFAVIALAAFCHQLSAQVDISGQVRLDKKFQSEPNTTDDSFDFERARLKIAADVAPNWKAYIRLEVKDVLASQASIDVQKAYAAWNGLEKTTFSIGKTNHLDADIHTEYCVPGIQTHGTLKDFSGNNDYGISLVHHLDSFGYYIGFAKTPFSQDSNKDEKVKFSMGGRVYVTALDTENASLGLGLGLLRRTFEDENLQTKESDLSNPDFSRFNHKEGLTLDLSARLGRCAFTAAYYGVDYRFKGADGTVSHNPYMKDGLGCSYFGEFSYLVTGDSYLFKNGVIQGPSFSTKALEVGVRLSQKNLYNAAAKIELDSPASSPIHRKDSNGDTTSWASGDRYKVTTLANSLFANYHLNKNMALKFEFFNSKETVAQNIDLYTTIPDIKNRSLTLRTQWSFS